MDSECLADVAFDGDFERVKEMVRLGADPNELNSREYSPLHAAIKGGHPEIVRFLLECGVDPDGQDGRGWTPLYRTIAIETDVAEQCNEEFPSTEILELLLEFGADANLASTSPGVPRPWERTPLQLARGLGNKRAEKILLGAGAGG